MKWQQINPYCIQSGPWRITKAFVMGVPFYLLWRNGEIVGDRHGSADSAKNECERLAHESK